MAGIFRQLRGTTRALIVWTAIVVILLAVALPLARWQSDCTALPGFSKSQVSVCHSANAPTVLITLLVLWAIGVVIIAIVRYVPLPTAKR